VSYKNYIRDARDADRQETLSNLNKGMHLYFLKTWTYPDPENIYGT